VGSNPSSTFVNSNGDPLANVSLHHGSWSREKLIAWLHSGDVLLYLSGGEGLGQMPLEAMATGLPVICANNTGMMEYLREDNAMLVPTIGRTRADSLSMGFNFEATMCQPDVGVAVEYLRWAYKHKEELCDIGDAGYYESLKWSWDDVAAKAGDMLLERYGH
jgi:glycosyltransferase involved in cell wall biosynthesis